MSTLEFDFSTPIDLPASGIAPHNEVTAMYSPDHGQRHENEATDPDNLTIADLASAPHTPAGFRWARDSSGNPTLVPLRDTVDSLARYAQEVFDDHENRYLGLKEDRDLAPAIRDFLACIKNCQTAAFVSRAAGLFDDDTAHDRLHFEPRLKLIAACLSKVDDRIASSMIRAVGKQAEIDMAMGGYWMSIHKTNVLRHNEAGNERASENSLEYAEISRAQMLIAAQLLDCCVEQGFKFNARRAANGAMRLHGWQSAQKILDDSKTRTKLHKNKTEQEKAFVQNFNF